MSSALAGLKEKKTPGSDGLSPEFYKFFWELLAPFLHRALIYVVQQGQLHISARRGVIVLIPKKHKDNLYIENWRPITLLTTDYKILAKALVNRIQCSLDKLISTHQTGFMQGRNISHNIRKILDIIEYTERRQEPGLIMSLDFHKCFDSLDHQSIREILRHYGFGQNFITLIMLLYTNIESCTLNNGFSSSYFSLEKGSPQGSPASTVIYLICAQLCSDIILNNPDIQGLNIAGEQETIVQFADDTNLFLTFSQATLDGVTQSLTVIYQQIGLRVNYDKTIIYRLGSLRYSNARLYSQFPIVWTDDPFSVLGIEIGSNEIELRNNFKDILNKSESILESWYNRNASLMGKVLIVNSLVGSLYVYKMLVLPNIDRCMLADFVG